MIYEPEDLMLMLPRRLEEAMKYKGFTPTQLSRVAKVDVGCIFRILEGTMLPRLETLTKICDALDVSPNFIISWEMRK